MPRLTHSCNHVQADPSLRSPFDTSASQDARALGERLPPLGVGRATSRPTRTALTVLFRRMADGGSACWTRRIPSALSGTARGPLSRAGYLLCSLVLGAARSVARDPRVLRAQPGAAVKQFARRVEVPGMDCGLGDDVQDDLPHVAEPPAAEVVRPSGRRRI